MSVIRQPSPEEIAEACRRIRDEGFWGATGWHGPWTEAEYLRRAGVVQVDVIPTVAERSLLDRSGG